MKKMPKLWLAMALASMITVPVGAAVGDLPLPKTIPDPAPGVGMADPEIAVPVGRGAEQGIYTADDIPVVYLEDPDFTDETKYIQVNHITAIGDVLEDGLVLSGLKIELSESVPAGLLAPGNFEVPGRTVVHSYVNNTGELDESEQEGKYVFLELLTNENPDSNQFKETSGQFCFGPESSRTWATDLPMWTSVRMVSSVFTPEGKSIAPFNMVNDDQYIKIVDDMIPGSYTDPKTGVTIKYNLFVPDGYDGETEYPILLFLHGAGESGYDNRSTLTAYRQGLEYASPEAQSETPCFILVPQCPMVEERGIEDFGTTMDIGGWYTYIDNEDGNTYTYPTAILEAVVNTLTDDVMAQYKIDDSKVYAAGHSMGGGGAMLAMAYHPDIFTAIASFASVAYLPDDVLEPVLDKPMLFTLAENDNVDRIRVNMPLMAEQMERLGGKVYRAEGDTAWDAALRDEENLEQGNKTIQSAEEAGDNIIYIEYLRGSVIPAGHLSHRASFENAAIRHWLFAQTK